MLMLLQRPGILEHLAAMVTPENGAVLLPRVLQVLGPSVPREGAALLLAGVAFVYLLVSLQPAGEGEPHVAAFMAARVRWQLRMLLAHVGLEQLVLLEAEAAAVKLAHIPVVAKGKTVLLLSQLSTKIHSKHLFSELFRADFYVSFVSSERFVSVDSFTGNKQSGSPAAVHCGTQL